MPINLPTWYTLSHIPTCIDHILTNQKSLFKFSKTFETDLSKQHKLISTTMKSITFKDPPKNKIYRCFKNVDMTSFSNTFKGVLEKFKLYYL